MKTARLKDWTYEKFMALPEGGPVRYEIIDEELCMTPARGEACQPRQTGARRRNLSRDRQPRSLR